MQNHTATPLIFDAAFALEWRRAGSSDAPCTRTSVIEGLQ